MKLHEYLSSAGSHSATKLASLIGVRNPAQVRQWQHGYANRSPNAENCAAIERATQAIVTCEELRPDIVWTRIKDKAWPHPKGRPLIDVAAKPVAAQEV